MKIKASYRFQLSAQIKSILIYYLVVFCAILFFLLLFSVSISEADNDQIDGLELASVIFLFVAGLNSFKDEFRMLIQNGISRKTIFIGRILTSLSVAAGMAVINKFFLFLLQGVNAVSNGNIGCSTLFDIVYKNNSRGSIKMQLTVFLFDFFLFLSFTAVGYFITTLYYRLGKAGKVALSVSLPVSIFVVLPILDYSVTNGRITAVLYNFLDFAFGVSSREPANEMVTCTLVFLVFSGFSWLLMRRASVKE